MVYSGKPSTGCYLCRRRKIKCDEGRPGCRNCETYGKECPGYRPAIVTQDKGYTLRKWRTSLGNDKRLHALITDEATPDFDPADTLALMPKPRWLADASMEDRALCYFFDQYTTPRSPDGVPGTLESIPLLYVLCRENEVAGSPSSCLRWAVEAAALTSFAHEADDRKLDLQAREKYVMAIHGLKEALSTPVEKVQDGTLAAILLLVIFEDINGERPRLLSSHTAGLELVTRLHTYRRLDSKYSRCLFNFAYVQLQIQILGLGGRPKLNLHFLLDLFDNSDPLQSLMGIVTKLSQLILDVPALVDDSGRSLLDTETINMEDLISYFLQVQSLDEELGIWCRSIPGLWLPRIIYSTRGEPLVTYASFSAGSLWNFYRCTRIFAHSIMDSLNKAMMARSMTDSTNDGVPVLYSSPVSHSQSTTYEVVQNLITDVCRSIPFLLGDIDSSGNPMRYTTTTTAATSSSSPSGSSSGSGSGSGSASSPDQTSTSSGPRLKGIEGYEMLWPFWHVLNSRFSTAKQRTLAQESLYRLDHDLGIKLAAKLADAVSCTHNL